MYVCMYVCIYVYIIIYTYMYIYIYIHIYMYIYRERERETWIYGYVGIVIIHDLGIRFEFVAKGSFRGSWPWLVKTESG